MIVYFLLTAIRVYRHIGDVGMVMSLLQIKVSKGTSKINYIAQPECMCILVCVYTAFARLSAYPLFFTVRGGMASAIVMKNS